MVQNIQEGQVHLEREVNFLKKIRSTNTDHMDDEKQNARHPHYKHHDKSPAKKKFEDELAETSEREEIGRASINRHNRDSYPQASPYSPIRRKSEHNVHPDELNESSKIEGKRGSGSNRPTDIKTSYEQSSYANQPRRKYEVPSSGNTTPSGKEPRSESSLDTSKYEQGNRYRPHYEGADNHRMTTAYDEKSKKPYPNHRTHTDPSKEAWTFKKHDQKEASLSSNWLDHEKTRNQFELKEAAIQKNKEKIKEDIEK